jgi:hypothetical protein
MKDLTEGCIPPVEDEHIKEGQEVGLENNSRRFFIGKLGLGTAAAVALAAVPFEPLIEGKHGEADASVIPYNEDTRAGNSYNYRVTTAQQEYVDPGVLPDNGDFARYSDYSGLYSKALKHDYLGIPNAASWKSMYTALKTGKFSDFENIQVGNRGGTNFTATLNGPQGAFAFDLEGRDSHATNFIGASPTDRSNQTAAEEIEHYWAALLRDTQFTQYNSNNPLVSAAVQDLNNTTYLQGPANNEYPFPLTPNTLFRGVFNAHNPNDPNLLGPYVSQFLLQPTFLGVQPITQKFQRFLSVGEGGADYLTAVAEYLNVENGFPPTGVLKFDQTFRYIRMGRDLAAYTHVDTVAQEYLIALLVLSTIKAPVNPGNPYGPSGVSPTEHAFFTFDSSFEHCDSAATLVEVATRALKAAWFHKWVVNLRMRPEEYAALVQARLANQVPQPKASADLSPDIFTSMGLQLIRAKYGTALLPQAFPEGCPTHPCYPTGHGTVLKFFYDGNQCIRPLLTAIDPARDVYVPSTDGLSLVPYTGNDRDQLTVGGELAKLGYNITFGHGIHAGIHFRSSSLSSLLLGEAVALTVLQDRADSYNEPFTVQITKFDGTTATISNES